MYTNSGTTASYIKLFAVLLVLNILWFSVADTLMRRSLHSIHTVIDATLYVIHRTFNTDRCLFTFTPVACSIFNFNEKAIRRQVLIRFVDRSVYRGLLFGPPRMLPHWTGVVHGHAAGATSLESS